MESLCFKSKNHEKLESSIFYNLDNGISEKPNFSIYPQPMSDHLKNRVKECGKLMYGALEIKKDDIEGRLNQLKAKFFFFGAPVGMLITVEGSRSKRLGSCWSLYTKFMSFINGIWIGTCFKKVGQCIQKQFKR